VLGKLARPVLVVGAVVALVVGCSNSKPLVNPNDPFNDPFFHDGAQDGTSALDEVLNEPAPSVGWLPRDDSKPPPGVGAEDDLETASGAHSKLDANGEGVLLKAEGDGSYVPAHPSEEEEERMYGHDQKSFYDKASEATLATMSILMGAGMAALPFLIGT
jgi:hypothetical protein